MANDKSNKISIDISSLTLLKILAVILFLAFLFYIREVVLLVFISLILAAAINPFVDYFQKLKVPRVLGLFFIYTLVLAAVFFSIYLLIDPLSQEIHNLGHDLPTYWQMIVSGWQRIQDFSSSHGLDAGMQNTLNSIQENLSDWAGNLFGSLINFVGGLFRVAMVLVMTFYLSLYDVPMKRKIRSLLPAKYQPYFVHLTGRVQIMIGYWLRGQLLLCFTIFVFSLVGLSILHVKYAWVLALVAGLAELVPYIGPIISGIPAVFVAFVQAPYLALAVAVLYVIIHESENYIIVPQIMKRAVGLNPVIVIIAMLIGAQVAGIAGIILAVPVATALGITLGDIINHWQSGFKNLPGKLED